MAEVLLETGRRELRAARYFCGCQFHGAGAIEKRREQGGELRPGIDRRGGIGRCGGE